MSDSDHPPDKPKTCPVCGVVFTRKEKKLNVLQWLGRKFCSRECMKKDPTRKRWGNR